MKPFMVAGTLLFAGSSAFSQQTAPDIPQSQSRGKIVYQRSVNDKPAERASKSGSDATVKSEITDADREAVTFTRYALDLRFRPDPAGDQPAMAVRAQIDIRNDGTHALVQIPLQLSSSLNWEEVRVSTNGAKLVHCRFLQTSLDSDADHTGELNEAAVVLPQPLAPGATLSLDVIYSGQASLSTRRLQGIGTPPDVAERSDWDRVAADFLGLRGFGNVAWYPVSSVPVKLGDGDKLFEQIARSKQRQAAALVSIKVTVETNASVPNIAILNGTVVPLTVAAGTEQVNVPSMVTCSLPAAPLGFQTMSIFLAKRDRKDGSDANVYALPKDSDAAANYLSAASTVTPLVRNWLGNVPKRTLSILDLPDTDDAPFEERATLYSGLQSATSDKLAPPLSHLLAHAYFESPRPWLNEGVAQFVSTLWTEQSKTRATAIDQLNEQRSALSLVEPADDATTDKPGLLAASEAIFYRTKSAYVLWMLRSMLGDEAMQSALKAYDPAADTTDNYFEQLVDRFAKAPDPEAVGPKGTANPDVAFSKDLHQIFEDWVYHDHGLPDLAITGVYTSKASTANSYIVAVNVSNTGGAIAAVPVTITSGTTQVTERMTIPAHSTAVRRVLIQDEPVQVQVNDGVVPETEASEHVQRIHYTEAPTP